MLKSGKRKGLQRWLPLDRHIGKLCFRSQFAVLVAPFVPKALIGQ
jgi:hypothetical protein